MRRLAALAIAGLAVLTACSPPNADSRTLRRTITASELKPRTFTYKAASPTQVYEVDGSIQDDFRFKMVLSKAGRDVMQYVVSDDALAVRIVDATVRARIDESLGHPDVDRALRAGEWVLDPSGAPPIVMPQQGPSTETTGDPFRDARENLRFVDRSIGQAVGVGEFSLEDISYRPLYDPWRYPDDRRGEVRYDLARPALPKNEGQARGEGDVTPAHFRKLSAFVQDGEVRKICSAVDVFGHEDYLRLKEDGPESNPFLTNLFKRVEDQQTAVPIEIRTVYVDIAYPDAVEIEVPADATVGKLTTFTAVVQDAVTSGFLAPDGDGDIRDCRRRMKTT